MAVFCKGTGFWAYPGSGMMHLSSVRSDFTGQILPVGFPWRGGFTLRGLEQWGEKLMGGDEDKTLGSILPFLTHGFLEAPPASLRGHSGAGWNRLEPVGTGWSRHGAALSSPHRGEAPVGRGTDTQCACGLLATGTSSFWKAAGFTHRNWLVLFNFGGGWVKLGTRNV